MQLTRAKRQGAASRGPGSRTLPEQGVTCLTLEGGREPGHCWGFSRLNEELTEPGTCGLSSPLVQVQLILLNAALPTNSAVTAQTTAPKASRELPRVPLASGSPHRSRLDQIGRVMSVSAFDCLVLLPTFTSPATPMLLEGSTPTSEHSWWPHFPDYSVTEGCNPQLSLLAAHQR